MFYSPVVFVLTSHWIRCEKICRLQFCCQSDTIFHNRTYINSYFSATWINFQEWPVCHLHPQPPFSLPHSDSWTIHVASVDLLLPFNFSHLGLICLCFCPFPAAATVVVVLVVDFLSFHVPYCIELSNSHFVLLWHHRSPG